jgi:tetratricopeptide (TPR) repeat protein
MEPDTGVAPEPQGDELPAGFLEAVADYQAGRLAEAEARALAVLARQPGHAPTAHLVGVIALARQAVPTAVAFLGKAVALAPDHVESWLDLGAALYRSARMEESASASRVAVGLRPADPRARVNLAAALRGAGRIDEARAEYRRAAVLSPGFAQAWYDLGRLLAQFDGPNLAIDCHRRAAALRPHDLAARTQLGVALASSLRLEEAEAVFREAARQAPDDARAHNNLSGCLRDLHHYRQADAECRAALALAPAYPEAWANLGNVLTAVDRLDEAVGAYGRARDARPDYAEVAAGLSHALIVMGRPGEAAAACRQAIAHAPSLAEAHSNLAVALLSLGEFSEGWREYEWRWRVRHRRVAPPTFTEPQWEGQPLDGRTLLLHPEQGFGDQLQFCRYASLAAGQGARVVLTTYPELVRLLSTLQGVDRVIAVGDPLPSFDYHQSVMSLPRVMGTTLDNIPGGVPYLRADAAAAAAWRRRLEALPGLKVGLVWAGESRAHDYRAQAVDRRRSVELRRLRPLLTIPGLRMVSLQMGPAAAQADELPAEVRPLEVMGSVGDFADTAAIVANLDLVISVDTAAVHLAGALGVPVWVMSRFDACWRWLKDRDDSPWYPNVRLFRQKAPAAWDELIENVRQALDVWVSERF